MARLSKEELDKVKKKYNVNRLYSYSMLNTFETSPYEYFLHYVLKKKADRDTSVYGPMGGACHDAIEAFYNGEIEYKDMLERFEDSWLTNIELAELKFDRTDEEKNASIASKYKENLELFFKNHKKIGSKVATEKFLAAKIGSFVLQGYSDAVYKDGDDYIIVDWKSSTRYTAKALEEHSAQLTVYAIALTQMGIPIENIKACFNFLKYCTVLMPQKNGKIKEKDTERRLLGDSMKTNVKMWMKDAGYSEDEIDTCLKLLIDSNSIDVLPDDIKCKYEIRDCYCYIPLDQKLVDKWTEHIIAVIRDINAREADYNRDKNDKVFWDDEESVKKESYYFANLCGYSPNLHLPYKEYVEKLEREKSDDIFGMMNDYSKKSSTNKVSCEDDMDLSWLDEL